MQSSPSPEEIKEWLCKENPLRLFRRGSFMIKDIDPKPWSGHFNYLIKVGRRKFVLRFKGPEWGERARGITDEFKILKYVEPYHVGPRVFYLTKKFFGEPMMLEEYLGGKILPSLPSRRQEEVSLLAARLLGKIAKISFRKKQVPFKAAFTSYSRHKSQWKKRLRVILRNPKTRPWGLKIEKLMPLANQMLERSEPPLRRTMSRVGPSFIFESAHAGHCLVTSRGIRFLNWEQVSCGDPAFMPAVFLASLGQHKNFGRIKKKFTAEYLKRQRIPEFRELLEQRLKEREISNLLWILWAYDQRKDTGRVEKRTSVVSRFRKVRSMLLTLRWG